MPQASNVIALTAQIVAAHLARNQVSPEALPELIHVVHTALVTACTAPTATTAQEPAVPIRRSVFPDHMICLEDGKRLRMLKRHLQSDHGMTPEQYREKWGLPTSYPMVAPNYASRRSELARKIGLGRKPAQPATAHVPVRKVAAGVSGRKPGGKKGVPAKTGAPAIK